MSTPEHQIDERPLTDDERQRIASRTNADFAASWGCLALPFALVTFGAQYVGGAVAGWPGRLLAVALGLAAFATAFHSFRRFEVKGRRQIRADLEAGVVQQIHVRTSRVAQFEPDHSSIDPAFAFDIGRGNLLVVAGQWIVNEPRTFGVPSGTAPLVDEDLAEAIGNRLPPPWSFPSDRFTLSRLPVSGEVLSVRVAGEALVPTKGPILEAARHRVLQSLIVEGSFEALAGALDRLPRE